MKDKPVYVGRSALKHGLDRDYIERMWYDESCEGFAVTREPPRESNVIVIRFLPCPTGTLEMIAEDERERYFVFHAQITPAGKETALMTEAFKLLYGR